MRREIGVVPQELALYDDLSARENLAFWGQMYGLSGKTLTQRVNAVLEQIGLTDKANKRIKTYSGGMKRRVDALDVPLTRGDGERTGQRVAVRHAHAERRGGRCIAIKGEEEPPVRRQRHWVSVD